MIHRHFEDAQIRLARLSSASPSSSRRFPRSYQALRAHRVGSRGTGTCRCNERRRVVASFLRRIRPAKICWKFMLPGSRCPRVREPITKSCVPLVIGSTSCGMNSGLSLPSPSRNTTMSSRTAGPKPRERLRHRLVRNHAAQLPLARRRSRARSAVRSVLPLSTTMTSSGTPVARHSRTTSAIGSSSFKAGMTTETLSCQNQPRAVK